jgi:hypothetical protein
LRYKKSKNVAVEIPVFSEIARRIEKEKGRN